MNVIKRLSDVGYSDIALVGGKAASLGEMLQAKISVPAGFVITTDAYHKGMSKELEQQILNAFDVLGVQRVAVRSSAVAEDSTDASWAGQLESYLNTARENLIQAVTDCWDSIKSERAQQYADEHKVSKAQQAVAVVVQAMVDSDISGVLFTANPVTQSHNEAVIEAVYGLGELLVQGTVTPETLIINRQTGNLTRELSKQQTMMVYQNNANQEVAVPANKLGKEILDEHTLNQLLKMAAAIEEHYDGVPQDIEWAMHNGALYAVQSRPITTLAGADSYVQAVDQFVLGQPNQLFYWGPSRAQALYMNDFMLAAESFFQSAHQGPEMPNPPKTLVLFCKGKMVWLNKADQFNTFVRDTFTAYKKQGRIDKDLINWQKSCQQLDEQASDTDRFQELLLNAWEPTLFAEFSLYGAEIAVAELLDRFDEKARQEIWKSFTTPDKPTFMQALDQELTTTQNTQDMAQKYPWVQDGYEGITDSAQAYFAERLEVLQNSKHEPPVKSKRGTLAKQFKLTNEELSALKLTRQLAEFMDDRKVWMMRTRRYIRDIGDSYKPKVQHGWFYDQGQISEIDSQKAQELWARYVDFKVSDSNLKGIVASSGGQGTISGKVAVISKPTDPVADDMILVVPSTSPSYVPLMRKARALITDHGGMMSHAAIVARELGLPCIAGTKQATKVLKKGDEVRLDLTTGNIYKS